jgi:amino acid permease
MASYFLFLHKGGRYLKAGGFIVLPSAVFILPWVYLKHAGFNSADRWRVFSVDWMSDISNYADILATLGSLVIDRNLSLLGITFIVAFVCWFAKNRNDKASLFLITVLAGSVFIFAVGSYCTGWPDQFARLVTQDTGLVLFFIMLQYGATIEGSAGQSGHKRIKCPGL